MLLFAINTVTIERKMIRFVEYLSENPPIAIAMMLGLMLFMVLATRKPTV